MCNSFILTRKIKMLIVSLFSFFFFFGMEISGEYKF